MGRRASAFTGALDELDELDGLPGLPTASRARTAPVRTLAVAPSRNTTTPPGDSTTGAKSTAAEPAAANARPSPPRQTAADTGDGPRRTGGTRATQVRLPPELARWLSTESHRSGRTLASVVALTARAHQDHLRLAIHPGNVDGLDVARPAATATVAVTLRLNGPQRQLLDDLAAEHTTTRSAIVVAALAAAHHHDTTATNNRP